MPSRKVGASALAGALSILLVGIVNTYVIPEGGTQISGEMASAATTVLSFVVGYFVAEPA